MAVSNHHQRCYAIDIDNTMSFAPVAGPVTPEMLKQLMDEGNIVGACGNFPIMMKYWPQWYTVMSFFGGHMPFAGYKPQFLKEMQQAIQAGNPNVVDFVMVGNSQADAKAGIVLPSSKDDAYARLAGWRFIKEIDFARGAR